MPVSTTSIPTILTSDVFSDWLIAANEAYSRSNAISTLINSLETSQGTLTGLATTDKTSVVAAINEINDRFSDTAPFTQNLNMGSFRITNHGTALLSTDVPNLGQIKSLSGDLTLLTTTDQSSMVNAINELDAGQGDLSTLTTTANGTLILAINELDGEIGSLSSLTTTVKTTIIGAINELDSGQGDLSTLATTDQSSVVAAINEILGTMGVLSSLTTQDMSSLVNALNEHEAEIGDMTLLPTTDKSSVVNAIIEMYPNISGAVLTTTNQTVAGEKTFTDTMFLQAAIPVQIDEGSYSWTVTTPGTNLVQFNHSNTTGTIAFNELGQITTSAYGLLDTYFVDTTNNETIAGEKTWSNTARFNAAVLIESSTWAQFDLRAGTSGRSYIDWTADGRTIDYDWRLQSSLTGTEIEFVHTNGNTIVLNNNGEIATTAYGNLHDFFVHSQGIAQPYLDYIRHTFSLPTVPRRVYTAVNASTADTGSLSGTATMTNGVFTAGADDRGIWQVTANAKVTGNVNEPIGVRILHNGVWLAENMSGTTGNNIAVDAYTNVSETVFLQNGNTLDIEVIHDGGVTETVEGTITVTRIR